MRKFWAIIKKYLFLIITVVWCVLVFALKDNKSVSAALAPINTFYAATVGRLASVLPFSLLGVLIFALLPLLVLIVVVIVKSRAKLKTISVIAAIVILFVSLFPLSFGFAYSDVSVYQKVDISLPKESVKEDLLVALDDCIANLNQLCAEIEFTDGHSVSPLTFSETADIICAAYDTEMLSGLPSYTPRPKRFFPSAIMNYAGITGVYFCFFAEPNVCENVPDKTLPHTIAHEIAHAKRVSNEGEANFIAFMVCINSPHPYVRYSGYSYALPSLLSALYSQDKELYSAKRKEVDPRVFSDNSYASNFFSQFESKVEEISTKVNDAYLKRNNVSEGVASYSTAVKGIIAYYAKYGKQS